MPLAELMKMLLDLILGKSSSSINGVSTIEDLPAHYIDKINRIILDEEKKQGSEYVGGSFKVNYVDDRNYYCSLELYFEKAGQEDPNLTSAQSKNFDLTKLTRSAQDELRRQRTIEFEIDPPTREQRDRLERSTSPSTSSSTRGREKSLDNVVEEFLSTRINQLILDTESRQGVRYRDGTLFIDYVDDRKYSCSYDLYFTKDGESEPRRVTSRVPDLDLQDLSKSAQDELRRARTIKFAIDPPSRFSTRRI